MPMFTLTPSPSFSPTRCCTCWTHKDPVGFVDLLVDDEAVLGYDEVTALPVPRVDLRPEDQTFGHLYICAGCLAQAAKLIGWASPERVAGLEALVDRAATIGEVLVEAVQHERATKVVSVDELLRRSREDNAQAA